MDGMHACDVVLSQKSSGDEVLYTRFFLLVELGRAELCQIRCATARQHSVNPIPMRITYLSRASRLILLFMPRRV